MSLRENSEEIGCCCENSRNGTGRDRCSMTLIVNDGWVRYLDVEDGWKTDAPLPADLCAELRDIIRWHREGTLNVTDEDIYCMVKIGDVYLDDCFNIDNGDHASVVLPVDCMIAFQYAFVDYGAEFEKYEEE